MTSLLCARLDFWKVSVRPKFAGRVISVKSAYAEIGEEGRIVTLCARRADIGAERKSRCVQGPAARIISDAGKVCEVEVVVLV